MLSPRGGRADNGWRKGDELCHQTRGLKDGPPECYQSCLDQDVRLSRSSVFSLLLLLLLPLALRALLPPFTLVLFSSSFTSLPPFLPPLLFPFFDSITSSVFLFPSPPSFSSSPSSFLLSCICSNSGPVSCHPPGLAWSICCVGKIFISFQTI